MERLTFKQRNGIDPLPEILKIGQLSIQLRNQIWSVLFEAIERYTEDDLYNLGSDIFSYPMEPIFFELWSKNFIMKADEYDRDSFILKLKQHVYDDSCDDVINTLDFLIGFPKLPDEICKGLSVALSTNRSAYRINFREKIIYPVSSEEQSQAIENSLEKISSSPLFGTQTHLKNSASALNNGKPSDSIRESIHAVESAVKVVTGKHGSTLSEGLKHLESRGINIHPVLKQAFEKLYAYTSDEKGVRHAMVNDEGKADEIDALFMFGACASFCSYLAQKLESRSPSRELNQ